MFSIARRSVDLGGVNQDLIYMSAKFVNGVWLLAEVKITPGSDSVAVSIRMTVKFWNHPYTLVSDNDVYHWYCNVYCTLSHTHTHTHTACPQDKGHGRGSWRTGDLWRDTSQLKLS